MYIAYLYVRRLEHLAGAICVLSLVGDMSGAEQSSVFL